MRLPTDDTPAVIVHGDCLALLRDLPAGVIDAVITDPPWGIGWRTDSTRFSGGGDPDSRGDGRSDWDDVTGDDAEFDPTPWLDFPRVVLFGANHFAAKLPAGTTLVWIKRDDHAFGSFLSDAEIGWMKGGRGVYCYRQVFSSPSRRRENKHQNKAGHPTQKPVGLMRWCIDRLKLPRGSVVLDPYCGSGSTGVACIQAGLKFIGIEIDEKFATIAKRRIDEALGIGGLFDRQPKALDLFDIPSRQ